MIRRPAFGRCRSGWRRSACATDLHVLDGEFAPTVFPIIPGHETSGTVSGGRVEEVTEVAGATGWRSTRP